MAINSLSIKNLPFTKAFYSSYSMLGKICFNLFVIVFVTILITTLQRLIGMKFYGDVGLFYGDVGLLYFGIRAINVLCFSVHQERGVGHHLL